MSAMGRYGSLTDIEPAKELVRFVPGADIFGLCYLCGAWMKMLYLIAKALLSGVIIMAASEAAKRSPTQGALLVSLPLISILAMVWLWRDTGDNERIAALSQGTFWLVLPTLPMFLVLPAMLRNGFAFWTALAASCALTVALYLVAVWLLPKLGINL
jgi:glycopeptide antibiotics resistance protein